MDFVLTLALLVLTALRADAQRCCGDCNADGAVTVDELLSAIGNASHGCDVGACCGDCDGDGRAQVPELVMATREALTACGSESICGGPLTSAPKLCRFRTAHNPMDLPDLLTFQVGDAGGHMSDVVQMQLQLIK